MDDVRQPAVGAASGIGRWVLRGAGCILIPLESDADQQSALHSCKSSTLSGTNSKRRNVTAATKVQ
jgi:hypothetical protein